MASWGLLGVSWEALGGFLEASWGFRGSSRQKGKDKVMQESLQMRLGAVLGPSWAPLGAILGPSWGHLGLIFGYLTRSSAILVRNRRNSKKYKNIKVFFIFGPSEAAKLGPSWAQDRVWRRLEASWNSLSR